MKIIKIIIISKIKENKNKERKKIIKYKGKIIKSKKPGEPGEEDKKPITDELDKVKVDGIPIDKKPEEPT
jgi:hypothetical protein